MDSNEKKDRRRWLQETDNSGTDENKRSNNTIVILVSVIIALTIVAIGVLIYCKKRRQITREIELQAADAVNKISRHTV